MGSKFQAFLNHPAGPKTIFFWAPLFKWGLFVANISELSSSPEHLSYPQQAALAGSSLIWARWSTIITPKNLSLCTVSIANASIASVQLGRKIKHEYASKIMMELRLVPEVYSLNDSSNCSHSVI